MAGSEPVELGDLGVRGGQADLQPFDFAGPAVALSLDDPVTQVPADFDDAGSLGRVGPEQWAPQAAVLVDARGRVSAATIAERDLAPFEMPEELLPFLIGWGAVLLRGSQGASPGDEGPVVVDDLLGIDRLVPERGVDVVVPTDQLGDMGWHAVEDGFGDKDPPEVVGHEVERRPGGIGETAAG